MVVIELWKQIAWPWHSVVGIATTFGVGFLLTAILDKKRVKCPQKLHKCNETGFKAPFM
jgi:hypothetical protein